MKAESSVKSGLQNAKSVSVRSLSALLWEESGQDLIEYALVFCLVMLGAVASMKTLGTRIATVFSTVGTTLTTAT